MRSPPDPANARPVDVLRAKIIARVAEAHPNDPDAPGGTQTEWIRAIRKAINSEKIKSEPVRALFSHLDERALQNSVSRGLKKLDIPPDLFTKK